MAFGKRERKVEEEEKEEPDEAAIREAMKPLADVLDDESRFSDGVSNTSQAQDAEAKFAKEQIKAERKIMIAERRLIYKRGINTLIHYEPQNSQLERSKTVV